MLWGGEGGEKEKDMERWSRARAVKSARGTAKCQSRKGWSTPGTAREQGGDFCQPQPLSLPSVLGIVTQEWSHSPGTAPAPQNGFGEREECHRDKQGQAGTGAHPPTLASESRFAGSAGMLSSTVLVSTATTPTGIPPSLQTGETENSCCCTSKHPGETKSSSSPVAFCRMERSREVTALKAKSIPKNEHIPL